MSVPDELRRYVPRTDLYDSLELVHYHMPVEQPPATASYIIFKKGNKTYAKNGQYGHIEYEDTDSASVIQSAVNNLPAQGGAIYIKPAKYIFNSTVEITKPIEIIGEVSFHPNNNGVQIHLNDPDLTAFKAYASSGAERWFFATFKNLEIQMASGVTANTAKGLWFAGYISDIRIENCQIFGVQDAIYISGGSSWNYWIKNCLLEVLSGSAVNVATNFAERIYLQLCHIFDVEYAVKAPASADYKQLISVVNNRIEDSKKHGLYLGGSYHRIVGNVIVDASRETTNTYSGIYLENTEKSIIVGNHIGNEDTSDTKYAVEEAGTADYNLIVGNILSGATGAKAIMGTNTLTANNIEL